MERLPIEIERELLKILTQNKEANLILLGYTLGKGFKGNIKLNGEFTIEDTTS